MVCILSGPDHVFEFVNEAHIKALGFDATGMAVRVAQPESVEVHGILDDVYRTGVTAHLNEIPVTLTDRVRYFDLTYAARRDEKGEINGIMILGVEITETVLARENLKASQAALQFALSNAQMGTWSVNLQSGDVELSQESVALFGLTKTKTNVDQTVESVIHPEDKVRARAELAEAIAEKKLYFSEYRIIRPSDQAQRWIMATGKAQYSREGVPQTLTGIIMDITERKTAEENLKNAIQTRDEFMSIASHELNTPLFTLKLHAQNMQRNIKKGDPTVFNPENVVKLVDHVDKQVNRLTRLVEDMLDISRLNTGKLKLIKEDVYLGEIVKEIAERFKSHSEAMGSKIVVEIKKNVMGKWDRVRLEQVIENLLTNSMKYGNKKPISIKIETQGSDAVLSISDQGIGISKDAQLRIFDKFERAISSSEVSGLGLGLFISHQIVAAHNGALSVESEEGKGATFVMRLPVQ